MIRLTVPVFGAAAPWAVAALVLTAAVVLLPLVFGASRTMLAGLRTNIFATTPLLILILTALAAREAGTPAHGASIGAVVGAGALLGTTIGLTILGGVAGSNPAIQDFVRASEPHPEARLPYHWIAPLGVVTGAFSGVLFGVSNLVMAVVVGMVVGTI
jgi:hypothetical protein